MDELFESVARTVPSSLGKHSWYIIAVCIVYGVVECVFVRWVGFLPALFSPLSLFLLYFCFHSRHFSGSNRKSPPLCIHLYRPSSPPSPILSFFSKKKKKIPPFLFPLAQKKKKRKKKKLNISIDLSPNRLRKTRSPLSALSLPTRP